LFEAILKNEESPDAIPKESFYLLDDYGRSEEHYALGIRKYAGDTYPLKVGLDELCDEAKIPRNALFGTHNTAHLVRLVFHLS
jgi:hypothetical protein